MENLIVPYMDELSYDHLMARSARWSSVSGMCPVSISLHVRIELREECESVRDGRAWRSIVISHHRLAFFAFFFPRSTVHVARSRRIAGNDQKVYF